MIWRYSGGGAGTGEAGAGDEGYYGEAGGAGERDGASGGDES